jgi:hypothetical protein
VWAEERGGEIAKDGGSGPRLRGGSGPSHPHTACVRGPCCVCVCGGGNGGAQGDGGRGESGWVAGLRKRRVAGRERDWRGGGASERVTDGGTDGGTDEGRGRGGVTEESRERAREERGGEDAREGRRKGVRGIWGGRGRKRGTDGDWGGAQGLSWGHGEQGGGSECVLPLRRQCRDTAATVARIGRARKQCTFSGGRYSALASPIGDGSVRSAPSGRASFSGACRHSAA